jgi:hypothetical protein
LETWVLLLGVVRGRAWEYMELMSAVCCLAAVDAESTCDAFETFDGLDSCGVDLEEPPPKTRLKNPGLGAAVVGCNGTCAARDATVGEGALASCHGGTGGKSRKVLALTNSCACALMLGPGWLLFFRKVL